MATYSLGRVGLKVLGEYNNITPYEKLDVVYFNGSSYVSLTDNVGVVPTNTEKWAKLAGGVDITDKEEARTSLGIQTGSQLPATGAAGDIFFLHAN